LEASTCALRSFPDGEEFRVEEFVPELAEEAFDVAVLPWRACSMKPATPAFGEERCEFSGSELGIVIEANLLGFAVDEKEPLELFDEVMGTNGRLRFEQEVLARCNVKSRQLFERDADSPTTRKRSRST